MPKASTLLCLCASLLLAACTSVAPLKVPAADRVVSIEARISNSYDIETTKYKGSVTITDPAKIAQVIAQVSQLNSGMSRSLDTTPTPTHTLVVTDKDQMGLVIFIGLNWIGGRNNVAGSAAEDRLRQISDEQRTALLNKVGINDYRF